MSIPDPIVLLDARARYVHPAFQMSRASTKTVWDSAGRLVTVPANAIGWDHDPATGQSRGYLAEPSATNLLLHSNDLTQGAWAKFQTTISPSAIDGPDGEGMAKVVEDSSSGQHTIAQTATITDGAEVMYQFIVRADERGQLRARIRDGGDAGANYVMLSVDISGGVISDPLEFGTATLLDYDAVPLGGGYVAVWLCATLGAGVTQAVCQMGMVDSGSDSASYVGDGASGLYYGYAQATEARRPGSYIPTGGATATRSADGLTLSDLSVIPGLVSGRGTVVLDLGPSRHPSGALFRYALSLGSGDLSLVAPTNGILRVTGTYTNGPINLYDTINDPKERVIVALAWDADEVVGAMDGAIKGSVDTVGTLSPSSMSLGNAWTGGGLFRGHIRRAVYYPQRLSNADLQSLTAIQE